MAEIKQKKYSDREMEQILKDSLDESKILYTCSKHRYVGGEKPPEPIGCADCWKAWWLHKIATTPKHLRQQRLEEAYRSVYDAVKAHERGQWDFEVFPHAQDVEIKKDAEN